MGWYPSQPLSFLKKKFIIVHVEMRVQKCDTKAAKRSMLSENLAKLVEQRLVYRRSHRDIIHICLTAKSDRI
jgi:ribosomal protein S3